MMTKHIPHVQHVDLVMKAIGHERSGSDTGRAYFAALLAPLWHSSYFLLRDDRWGKNGSHGHHAVRRRHRGYPIRAMSFGKADQHSIEDSRRTPEALIKRVVIIVVIVMLPLQ